MYTATSQTISEIEKGVTSKEYKFQIMNGNTGEVIIVDPLLETEAQAEERAMSEFIKQSYELREITFSTHIDTLYLNQVINVLGLPYLIKSIDVAVDDKSIVHGIKAVRYE